VLLVCGHFSIGIAVLSLYIYLSVVFKKPFWYVSYNVFRFEFIVVVVVVVIVVVGCFKGICFGKFLA